MRSIPIVLAASALLFLLSGRGARAETIELDGMKYESTINVVAQDLVLNGVGTKRNKLGRRDYAVALYLKAKAKTPEAVLASPGAMSIGFRFLDDVNSDAMGFLTTRVEANMEHADYLKAINGMMRLGSLLGGRTRFKRGDSFTLEYQPGNGTSLRFNNVPQGAPITAPEFFKAMLLVWLGPHPADEQMKLALLGG